MARLPSPYGCIFFLSLMVGCRPELPTGAPHSLLNGEAPFLSLPTLDGHSVDTSSLRGQLVVVKFFAQWCEPCQRTLPEFERLHRMYDKRAAFFGISEDERVLDARAQVDAYGLSFPVVLDRGGVLRGRFRVAELPMVLVLDRQGVIRWVGGPEQTALELREALDSLR